MTPLTDEELEGVAGRALAAHQRADPAAFASEMLSVNSAGTYAKDAIKGLDLYQTANKLMNFNESELYFEFQAEYLNNDFAQFLVGHLVGGLMDFKFESQNPGDLRKVQDFFYTAGTTEQLSQIAVNSVVYGTGIGQRWGVGKRLDNVTRVDSSSVQIYKNGTDRKGNLQYTYKQQSNTDATVDQDPRVQLNPDAVKLITLDTSKILAFRPIEVQRSAYGVSMMRSSLLPLQAIRQLNMDIPAGIKRLAYETMVLYLDLEGVSKENQKSEITKALKTFTKYDSATSTIVGMDKRHQLFYVGAQGSGGQKIIPILDILEPLLIFVLNKWHVPLAEVLQEKSNRAVATTQGDAQYQRLKALKHKWARFIETEIITHILGQTGSVPSVRVVHNVSFGEVKDELTFLLDMYKHGALPREYIQSKMDIKLAPGSQTYYLDGKAYLFDGTAADKVQQVLDETPTPTPPPSKPAAPKPEDNTGKVAS